MKEEDIKHLEWIYKKILSNNPSISKYCDYMVDFKSIIDSLKPAEKSETGKFMAILNEEMEKPAMKETKYKLVIPDEVKVKTCNIRQLESWVSRNGEKCELRKSEHTKDCLFYYFDNGWDFAKGSFLEEFLVEIKEELIPCTAEEYAKAIESKSTHAHNHRGAVIEAFKAGEKNEQLKHRETETCENSFEIGAPFDGQKKGAPYDFYYAGWKACNKSRGYE